MAIRKVEYSRRFQKDLRKASAKVQKAFRKRLEIFLNDKFSPILNNHKLTGKYGAHRSINVTGDWRAIFREFEKGRVIYFDVLGTHSDLYK